MRAQRVREGESRVECRLLNGPQRAQGKAFINGQVFCDVKAYVSCQGYDSILASAQRVFSANQGGTAEWIFTRP